MRATSLIARSSALLVLLLLLERPTAVLGKKKGKKRNPAERTEARPFTQAHPQQAPRYEQIREEDIPAGTPIKKIREGEVLNLAENAEKEAARKQPKEVVSMFDAVMSDDFGTLNKVLMEEKVPVDIRGPNGYTPLFQAVFSHKINSAHMLLEAGANPRLRNNQGFNALDAAAYSGCVRCCEMLLQQGKVSPLAVGRDGYSPFHRAIWGDDPEHTEVVSLMLEAGASPSKVAHVPGQGTVAPVDMVNENEDTAKLLKRWLAKEKKKAAAAGAQQEARAAEEKEADAVFGKKDSSSSPTSTEPTSTQKTKTHGKKKKAKKDEL